MHAASLDKTPSFLDYLGELTVAGGGGWVQVHPLAVQGVAMGVQGLLNPACPLMWGSAVHSHPTLDMLGKLPVRPSIPGVSLQFLSGSPASPPSAAPPPEPGGCRAPVGLIFPSPHCAMESFKTTFWSLLFSHARLKKTLKSKILSEANQLWLQAMKDRGFVCVFASVINMSHSIQSHRST